MTQNLTHIDKAIVQLKLKRCRCNYFILDSNSKNKEETCKCGLPRKKHAQDAFKPSDGRTEWLASECTVDDKLTNAFGDMRFIDNSTKMFINTGENISKFIRCDYRTSCESLLKIMFGTWRMYKPKLIISITGGADSFNVKSNLKNALNKGIVKAALGTNGWLITGGNESGIMKNIGEAVKETAATLDPTKKIILLGIAPWHTVKNNYLLLRKKRKMLYSYLKKDDPRPYITKTAALDPNHTHFILVDNAELNKFGAEINLRSELEKAISNYNINLSRQNKRTGELNEHIPMVVIVVGGGPNTYDLCLKSLKSNSPCIFIKDSGGCADIFSFIYEKMLEKEQLASTDNDQQQNISFDDKLKEDVLEKIRNALPKKDSATHEEILNGVVEAFTYMNLITIISLDSSEKIDEAILYSLFKAKKNESKTGDQDEQLKAQLRLALTWDRIDIANKFIFNEEKNWKTEFFKDIMFIAIKNDNVDFVKAFLKCGLSLPKYLTYRCLLKLYNEIPKNSYFFKYLLQRKRSKWRKPNESMIIIRFKDIGETMQSLLDNFYTHSFLKFPFSQVNTKSTKKILDETNDFGQAHPGVLTSTLYQTFKSFDIEDPCIDTEHHLFIFCVLTVKPKLAKLFLKEGINEIISSLIASKIYKSYAKIYDEESLYFKELASEFEKMALNMLQMSYDLDPKHSKFLIMRQVREFGYSNCLQTAKIADCIEFLSHNIVQELLTTVWYHKISPDTNLFAILLSMLIPFVAPYICIFKSDNSVTADQENKQEKNEKKELSREVVPLVKNRITLETNQDLEIGYFERIYDFFKTPYVKFLYDKILYIVFLLLFSYVLVCDFYPIQSSTDIPTLITNFSYSNTQSSTSKGIKISWVEVIVIIWVYSYFLDEIHQFYVTESKIVTTKIRFFFAEVWNNVEFLAICLFTIGMILRFIVDCPSCYSASRIILSFDIIVWYCKALHAYTAVKWMGPKLNMIKTMSVELASFVLIMAVCWFAFGITTQSLLYHNVALDLNLLRNIFFPSFFFIDQQYDTLDAIMNVETCNISDPSRAITDIYSSFDCPDVTGAQITILFFVVYLLFLNVLLVNLLIAIFSNTYDEIEQESDKIYKCQRYALVYEYFHKPFILAPFIILYYVLYVVKFPLRVARSRISWLRELKPTQFWLNRTFLYLSQMFRNGFKVNFDKDYEKYLIQWESNISDEFVALKESKENERIESKLKQNLEKYTMLVDKFNIIMTRRTDLTLKLDKIDNCLNKIRKKLRKEKSLKPTTQQKQHQPPNYDETFKSSIMPL